MNKPSGEDLRPLAFLCSGNQTLRQVTPNPAGQINENTSPSRQLGDYRCGYEEWPDWFQACHLPVENWFHFFLTTVNLAPPEPGQTGWPGSLN